MAEALGRYLLKLVSEGSFQGLRPSSSNLVCSHQQFVGDTILLGSSTIREEITLKNALNLYSKASGQLINWNKSSLFFFNTLEVKQRRITDILGCDTSSFPSTYLGLTICLKSIDTSWLSLIDRFNKKLAGWKGALLSQMGKLQLLKSTLQNLPVYA
ncbi:uncharacterized protein LOC131856371 [Cryptomeria japonica]|uniref:uncharacterized protein LOC131856371 n=1 Tax=Cryptomeria japonica TaxID=3369 RepID=UPI0027DA8565|nr:uncharacterized protein LOC131856371 [Cryptomeria japonica]